MDIGYSIAIAPCPFRSGFPGLFFGYPDFRVLRRHRGDPVASDRLAPQKRVRVDDPNPRTTFVAAHLAWLGGDLARLGVRFDSVPKMHAEIGAVLSELGRQPRCARAWFIQYQDRILFGKDAWNPEQYHVYFRTHETADEYFDYHRKRHAFWKLYGLDLPDDVLKKVYYENALRVIPGIDRSQFS